MNFLFCSVRKILVPSTPEEKVRQSLIQLMVTDLGYPLQSLVIEKSLSQIPHLAMEKRKIPSRRADILCLAKDIHPSFEFFPLLLVECKAVPITQKTIQQVVGYNYYLQAYFIVIANENEIQTGWFDPVRKDYSFITGLPKYSELLKSLSMTGFVS